jgi:molybdenum cofactor biosynthesis protein B
LLVTEHIDAGSRGRLTANPLPGPAPFFFAVADDEGLGDKPTGKRFRCAANAEHLGRQPLVVDLSRGVAHLPEAREQFVPQHGSSLTISVMTVANHKAAAPSSVRCFIVTVSDTRTLDNDVSGRTVADLLTAAGHVVAGRTVVRDDPELVHSTIERHLADRGVQVIITNGGTGITSRDSTYEAISTLLEKRLDGFGELFRMLSYREVGPAAMMSRACAGLVARRIVVALPGSPGAVRLAMEKLIIPELGHLVEQASK